MHSIKTLAVIEEHYAMLRYLQKLHRVVQGGGGALALTSGPGDSGMRFTDPAALELAIAELRGRITVCRQQLLDMGFNPDKSDPDDDED